METRNNIMGAQVNITEIIEAAHKIVKGEFVNIIYMSEPSMRRLRILLLGIV